MKKFHFIAAIGVFLTLQFTACTTDAVQPTIEKESEDIPCSCTPGGNPYTVTGSCAVDGYCDCSNPTKPRIVCCDRLCTEE